MTVGKELEEQNQITEDQTHSAETFNARILSLSTSFFNSLCAFERRGLFGLAYWYSVLPFHAIVFRGMLSGVEREALKIAASPQNMSGLRRVARSRPLLVIWFRAACLCRRWVSFWGTRRRQQR